MQKFLQASLRAAVRLLVKPLLGPPVPIWLQRAGLKAIGLIMLSARGAVRQRKPLAGVPVEWVEPAEGPAASRVVVYLHGGAYVIGSPDSHRAITTHLAQAAAAAVVAVDYRLAPEHPYPAALEDVIAVYQALLQQFGAERIALAGDSAGANLVLASVLALRDRGLPLPASLALIAPWVDMTASGESIRARAKRDPMLRPAWIDQAAAAYGGDIDRKDPRLSPLFADLRGLPPTLIQVASEEILHDDALRLQAAALQAGVDVRLRVWEGLWHVFQLHAGLLDVANQSLAEIAAFLRQRWQTAEREPGPI